MIRSLRAICLRQISFLFYAIFALSTASRVNWHEKLTSFWWRRLRSGLRGSCAGSRCRWGCLWTTSWGRGSCCSVRTDLHSTSASLSPPHGERSDNKIQLVIINNSILIHLSARYYAFCAEISLEILKNLPRESVRVRSNWSTVSTSFKSSASWVCYGWEYG